MLTASVFQESWNQQIYSWNFQESKLRVPISTTKVHNPPHLH